MCPQGKVNEPQGVKNELKKKRATAGPYRPLGGPRCRDHLQQYGPFGAKIKNSTLHSKKFQYKPSSC
jgi:hypothetical protein